MSKASARPAAQPRAIRTRNKLLAALETLLRDRDFDAISINDLAREAGVAVGTVYRRFENKEALVPLLFELWQARSRDQAEHARLTAETVRSTELRTLLRLQMRAAYSFIRAQSHIIRAVYVYGRLRPDLIGEEWKAVWEEAQTATRAFLELVSDRIARRDLDRAAEMVLYIANTALLDKPLFRDDGAGHVVSVDGDGFADEIADMIHGYLQTPDLPTTRRR